MALAFLSPPNNYKVTGTCCLACFLQLKPCMSWGWRCRRTRSLVTAKSPWKRSVVRRWGRDADRDRSSPQRVPHCVSVCGAPMFSGKPLSIQGSAVHRVGLANVCFAECSDDSAQLMVWASETRKLEGNSRSPQYRMGETRLGKELTSVGS